MWARILYINEHCASKYCTLLFSQQLCQTEFYINAVLDADTWMDSQQIGDRIVYLSPWMFNRLQFLPHHVENTVANKTEKYR